MIAGLYPSTRHQANKQTQTETQLKHIRTKTVSLTGGEGRGNRVESLTGGKGRSNRADDEDETERSENRSQSIGVDPVRVCRSGPSQYFGCEGPLWLGPSQ